MTDTRISEAVTRAQLMDLLADRDPALVDYILALRETVMDHEFEIAQKSDLIDGLLDRHGLSEAPERPSLADDMDTPVEPTTTAHEAGKALYELLKGKPGIQNVGIGKTQLYVYYKPGQLSSLTFNQTRFMGWPLVYHEMGQAIAYSGL